MACIETIFTKLALKFSIFHFKIAKKYSSATRASATKPQDFIAFQSRGFIIEKQMHVFE